ncbi:reductase [Lentilactobacillus sp. Marseille-Q4993]|uniref:reductase n=1 Tax=Lentilactobacillus sp. Marseille-Q4993 TaxID=3039492 RepID=UPI0024BCB56B|nr:reductase [Lentilactobacillus sp. Marseille-Q4993]
MSLITDFSNMDLVTQEMNWYGSDDNRLLYLWKDKSNNWSAVLGVELNGKQVTIHQLILAPQAMSLSNSDAIFSELQELFPKHTLVPSFSLKNVFNHWKGLNQ